MIDLSLSRRIWSDAVDSDSTPMTVATIVLLVAASFGGFIGIIVWKSVPLGMLRGAGNPLSVAAFIYWALFMSGAASHNRPANACLVPGLTRRVRQTAVLAWLATMAPFACVAVAHPQGWMALLCASVCVTACGLYRAGCERFSYLATLAGLGYLWLPSHPYLGDGVLAAACAASLLFAAWALGRAFPQGGERHFGMLGKHATMLAMEDMEGMSQWARTNAKLQRVYSYMLRRDLASKDAQGLLLMQALGPTTHRMLMLVPTVIVVLCAIAVLPVTRVLGFAPDASRLAGATFTGLAMMLVFSWYRFVSTIRVSTGEQAIARLAPGLPSAHQLNRQLGRQVLGTCLAEWVTAVVLLFGSLALWGAPRADYLSTGAMLAAILPAAAFGLADHAGKSAHHIGGIVVLLFICVVLAFIAHFWTDRPLVWAALVLVIVGIGSALVTVRWHAMMAAPPAFPAMRMD